MDIATRSKFGSPGMQRGRPMKWRILMTIYSHWFRRVLVILAHEQNVRLPSRGTLPEDNN
jgi:hypothetical protein